MRRPVLLLVAILSIFVVSNSGLLSQSRNNTILLGIWANPQLGSPEQAIETREGLAPGGVNRPFALHLHYYGWTKLAQELDSAGVFHPDSALQGDITHGRIPVISLTCDGTVANSDGVIAAGDPSEDANIMATAHALAQYPGPVLLRWFWEFNVLANNQNCRGDAGGPPTQQVYTDFIGAWRHIRQLFQKAGATNVFFLWNPGHYEAEGGPADPHSFYPGNDFVDWLGVDTYQRAATATFADDLGLFYADFSQSQYGGKPLMVGENGSQNFAVNSRELQSVYIQGLLADVQSGLYPQLKAYCYFDSQPTDKPDNWVLDDNNGSGNGGLAAFAALGSSPAFSAMPNTVPVITKVSASGKTLLVSGFGFTTGSVLLVSGQPANTKNDPANPATSLIGKKALKLIPSGGAADLEVQNPNGLLSPTIVFTRP